MLIRIYKKIKAVIHLHPVLKNTELSCIKQIVYQEIKKIVIKLFINKFAKELLTSKIDQLPS